MRKVGMIVVLDRRRMVLGMTVMLKRGRESLRMRVSMLNGGLKRLIDVDVGKIVMGFDTMPRLERMV